MRRIRVAVPVDTMAERIGHLTGFAGFLAALLAASFALPDLLSYVIGNQVSPAPVSPALVVVEFDDLYAATRPAAAHDSDLFQVSHQLLGLAPRALVLDASVMPETADDARALATRLRAQTSGTPHCLVLPARIVENSGVNTVVGHLAERAVQTGFVLQAGTETPRDAGLHARLRHTIYQGYGRIEGEPALADAAVAGCAADTPVWPRSRMMRYRGPLTSESGLARVSALDVLTGELPDEWFAGKVVLLGRNTTLPEADERTYNTPFGLRGSLMVQANAINARLAGVWWEVVPGWVTLLVAGLLLAVVAGPIFFRGFSSLVPLLGLGVMVGAHALAISAGQVLPATLPFRVWLWAAVLTYLLAPRGRRYRWAAMPEPESAAGSAEAGTVLQPQFQGLPEARTDSHTAS